MTENILDADTISQVKDFFAQMDKPVEILFFSKGSDCHTCEDMRRLAAEVAALDDKISLTEHDIEKESALAGEYHVDKAPALVIAGKDDGKLTDFGLRYAGVPAGHEFGTFIRDLVLVSKRESGLGEPIREYLGGLKKPLKLMVFYTPTCPHCPRAVSLAHAIAIESPLVQAEAISAMEFFDLANQYEVSGVPHTAILDEHGSLLHTVIGGVPEQYMLDELKAKVS